MSTPLTPTTFLPGGNCRRGADRDDGTGAPSPTVPSAPYRLSSGNCLPAPGDAALARGEALGDSAVNRYVHEQMNVS